MGAAQEPSLDETDLADGWLSGFERWLAEARAAELIEPEAMVVASADEQGRPSARTVLMKAVDERGFVFFTNYGSRKGRQLAANPHAALVFGWLALHRQVLVTGTVERVDDATSDHYFQSRAYGSRIGAIASPQSSVLSGREQLEQATAAVRERHPPEGPVPRPANWGGLRVVPDTVEFWQGRRDRLHDRLRFRREQPAGDWLIERLAP